MNNRWFDPRHYHSLLILGALFLAGCGSSSAAESNEPATLTSQQAEGQHLFTVHCSSCHSTLPDSVIVGPSMAGVATRAETRIAGMEGWEYVEDSIMHPSDYVVDGFADLMPKTLAQTLTKEEVDALAAYLMTLKE